MAENNLNNSPQWCIANFKGGDYRFAPEQVIVMDSINADEGAQIEIKNPKLAFIDDRIVTDTNILSNIVVKATVVKHKRADKIIVFKWRRRKNSRRKKGHRQDQTVIKIDSIAIN